MRALGCLAAVALGCSRAWAAAAPAVIEEARYASPEEARLAWKPMAGSLPVHLAAVNGRPALRFACNFGGTDIPRASWDRAVPLDLASCRGVQFQLMCADPSPVSYFSLYFQSGAGWYHASFYPESAAGWNTITIDKAATTSEGRPAGWDQVSAIRLSAWRSLDVDTEFLVRDLRCTGVLGVDAEVAVVRGDSAAQRSPSEARSVAQFAEAVAHHLSALEIGCSVISDLDMTAQRLRPARLVILPHNPSLPPEAAGELLAYAQEGGKLLAFYTVPELLYPILGVEGGRHVREERSGQFAAIRFAEGALPEAPAEVNQHSWNIHDYRPRSGRGGRVLAEWVDDRGRATGYAAVLGSTNGLVMTHVLLPEEEASKGQMLLAMAGYLAPELWETAAAGALNRIGQFAGFGSAKEAEVAIGKLVSGRSDVEKALGEASALRWAAEDARAKRQYAASLRQASAASQRLLEAFCLAQPSQANEFRAFWCHSALGVSGLTWDEAVGALARHGFNAVLPNMLWGGVGFYPSEVLPVAPAVGEAGDQIAQCLAACRKHGVQLHVWKVNWNLGHAVPRDFLDRMRTERRLQTSVRGQEEPWLCPSHPANRRLEIDSLLEVARRYDVDGLHFDYIRYPDGDHCFCEGCRSRFEQAHEIRLEHWPGDVLNQGPHRGAWLDWRRANITAVVQAVSEQARTIRSGLKISAAVFRDWPRDRDGVGQDWKLWCDRGYLDFVCPMDYTTSTRQFEGMVSRQVEWARPVPCYPGIGVSASSSRFGPDRVIEQIQLTRRYQTGGFVIFNYGVAESRDLLPLLGMGITAAR